MTLADGASKVDGSGASVDGDVVTITAAGTYLLSGELTDGQVVVNSTGEGKVKLVLDGVDITSSDTSPMVIAEADEAVVILADGSTNELADSKVSGADDEEDDAPNATLFSMADLTIAGTGSLQVSGNSNDGIASKDGLVILSGEVEVTATDDGVRGKDYLVIEGGTVTVVAGGDGLKSDNETEGELGWVQLDAGTVIIDAGDDGVDAIGAINVAGGTLRVIKSEEGLEAATITIAGGTVDVTANDDGLNATDGSEATEAAQDGVLISITGGDVAVTAGSDGIDSNGSTIITGGTTVVSTAARGGGDGSIDVNGALAVNGEPSWRWAASQTPRKRFRAGIRGREPRQQRRRRPADRRGGRRRHRRRAVRRRQRCIGCHRVQRRDHQRRGLRGDVRRPRRRDRVVDRRIDRRTHHRRHHHGGRGRGRHGHGWSRWRPGRPTPQRRRTPRWPAGGRSC